MFLTNKIKTTGNIKTKSTNNKALGGWDDDQTEASSAKYTKFKDNNNAFSIKPQPKENNQKSYDVDLLGEGTQQKQESGGFQFNLKPRQIPDVPIASSKNKKNQIQRLYSATELNSMPKIDCQRKVVDEVLPLGGIRVKQSDAVLNQFYNQAKGMDIPIIGSLLISHLEDQDASFEIKAKSIYAIEHLSKKSVQYSVYFKLHSEAIKNSPDPSEHQQNYLKIKKNLLGTLGALIVKPEQRKLIEEQLSTKEGINYVDPGYNKGEDEGVRGFITMSKKNSDKNQQQKPNKKLISPMDAKNKQKKVLQGPKKAKNDIEDYNLLGDSQPIVKAGPKKSKPQNLKQQQNLLDITVEKKQDNLLSFEEVTRSQANNDLI